MERLVQIYFSSSWNVRDILLINLIEMYRSPCPFIPIPLLFRSKDDWFRNCCQLSSERNFVPSFSLRMFEMWRFRVWRIFILSNSNQGGHQIREFREFREKSGNLHAVLKKWKIVREKGIKMPQNQGKSIDWRIFFLSGNLHVVTFLFVSNCHIFISTVTPKGTPIGVPNVLHRPCPQGKIFACGSITKKTRWTKSGKKGVSSKNPWG